MVDLTESHYSTGTASVAAGGTAVTGQGTSWAGAVRPGDLFGTHVGLPIRILSVDSNTSLTLAHEWPGDAQTAAAYEIQRTPYDVGYRKAIEDLVTGIAEGNLPMFAALIGAANKLPYFDSDETMAIADFPGWARSMLGLEGGAEQVLMFESSGTMTTVPRSDLVSGANYDVQVDTLAERSAYDGRGQGFAVLVANTGDGRAAIYTKLSDDSDDWSDPAYVTGPAYSLTIGDVEEIPYGEAPNVTLNPDAGGASLNFDLPKGMTLEPGSTTTLPPDQNASVAFVPIIGGYRVDFSIPRGPTGDINGVTPFWNTRLGSDADAAAARAGLDALNSTPIITEDWDAISSTGLYTNSGSSAIGVPIAAGALTCLHVDYSSNAVQIAFRSNSSQPQTWRRSKSGGTWGAWEEIYTSRNLPLVSQSEAEAGTGTSPKAWSEERVAQAIAALAPEVPADVYQRSNILGTVAQSGGVPTGAVIERGSNSNGQYVRFADGTQICWATVRTNVSEGHTRLAVGVYLSDWVVATFPVAFSVPPRVVPIGERNASDDATLLAFSRSVTSTSFAIATARMESSGLSGFSQHYYAIGRWF